MIEIRRHLTESITRARLKLELRRSARPFAVFVLAIVLSLAGAGWILSNIARTMLSDNYEVAFAVRDATAVTKNVNEVRVKGIPAGTITDVRLEGRRPVLRVEIPKKWGKVYKDARAVLRPNTALQDMYLDVVDRGTPAAGQADPDEPLSDAQTTTGVRVDEVLGAFQADVRQNLTALLDQLGNGLEDRGAQLREVFAEAVPLVQAAQRISEQLAAQPAAVRRLVHNAAELTEELGSRDADLRRLVRAGGSTLSVLQAKERALDATLRQLPGTLTAADRSFAATSAVLPEVNAAVQSLYPVADELPESLSAVRRLSRVARPAIDALQTPVRRLVPLSDALAPIARHLDAAVTTLRPQTRVLDRTTRNLANCEKGVQGFFQWDASMTKYGDRRGPVPRGNFAFGIQSTGLSAPDEYATASCTPGGPISGRPPKPSDGH